MPTARIKNENENQMHFLTITVIEWIDVFTKPIYFKVIIDSLRYCQKNKGLELFEYVIMTNHMHLIVRAKEGFRLSQIINDFKKYTTSEFYKKLESDNRQYILNLLKNSYSKKKGYSSQLWQRENYPEVVYSFDFLKQKSEYIYNNPVKKEYVMKPEDWIYSSARNRLIGDESAIVLDSYKDF